jgi:predicted heme/steroid binding protein
LAAWLEFDVGTGEFLDCPVNKYGEGKAGCVFGVVSAGVYVVSRVWRWAVGRVGGDFSGFSVDADLRKHINEGVEVREVLEARPPVVKSPSVSQTMQEFFISNPVIEVKFDLLRDKYREWRKVESDGQFYDMSFLFEGA